MGSSKGHWSETVDHEELERLVRAVFRDKQVLEEAEHIQEARQWVREIPPLISRTDVVEDQQPMGVHRSTAAPRPIGQDQSKCKG